MRLLVCGGRDFLDGAYMTAILDVYDFSVLICGMARGADSLAYHYSAARGIPIEEFPANWKLHGKRAGFIRNREMLTVGKPDLVIAFPGGAGTADMCKAARTAGVEIISA